MNNKKGVFASVAAVALMFGSAPVSADVIGAVDNIAPIVPGNFFVEPDLGSASVILTWDLSESDVVDVTATGNNADADDDGDKDLYELVSLDHHKVFAGIYFLS